MFFRSSPPRPTAFGVHNGNLTEHRGGSRYVSGANRLQEAHNYVSVDDLQLLQGQSIGKFGTGVLWVNYLNATVPPGIQNTWSTSPRITAGVMRLGSVFSGQHYLATGQQVFSDSGFRFGIRIRAADQPLGHAPSAVPHFPRVPAFPASPVRSISTCGITTSSRSRDDIGPIPVRRTSASPFQPGR